MAPIQINEKKDNISVNDSDPKKGAKTLKFGMSFGETKKVPPEIFQATERKLRSQRFDDWRKDLLENGFALVKGAMSPQKAKQYQQRAFQWATSFGTELDFSKPNTWTKENIPAQEKLNIFMGNAILHEKFMWDIRTDDDVIKPFLDFYGTDDLLVSFDTLNITFPNRKDKAPIGKWPHVDQSPFKKGLQCVQGLVSLSKQGEKDGGLVVYRKSHKYNEEFFKTQVPREQWDTFDWYSFSDENMQFLAEKNCEEIKISCEPGDMILWDSRTCHWGKEPDNDSQELRTVVYVSYSPRYFSTEETLQHKRKAFEQWSGTTHWSHDNIIFSPNQFEEGNGKLNAATRLSPLEKPEMTTKLLRLAGY